MTNLPKFSTALLHPRYWLTWLGIGAFFRPQPKFVTEDWAKLPRL